MGNNLTWNTIFKSYMNTLTENGFPFLYLIIKIKLVQYINSVYYFCATNFRNFLQHIVFQVFQFLNYSIITLKPSADFTGPYQVNLVYSHLMINHF